MVPVFVGSPQGSKLSPLLFIILTSDTPECVSEASIVTYADDTPLYLANKDLETVHNGLESAADEILQYMRTNYLAANADKTKFIMFGRKTSKTISVGSGFVEESESKDLLGIKISKNLTSARQVEGLK
jgi:hypothetical protein